MSYSIEAMKQKITGFHQDVENHWVAELECGHAQHVRHDPPWMERPWVLTTEGRTSRLGVELNCVRCDEMGRAIAAAVLKEAETAFLAAYENAGLSGLCDEGRLEVAIGALRQLDLEKILEASLKGQKS